MVRMVGFLTGAAVATLLMWHWFGPAPGTHERPAEALPPPVNEPGVAETAPVDLPAGPDDEDVQAPPPEEAVVEAAGIEIPDPLLAMATPPSPSQTQLFWSPFRSERAARGFADGIHQRSDIEIAVVRVAPLQYRLGFDYREASEREARFARIELATGLDLSRWSAP